MILGVYCKIFRANTFTIFLQKILTSLFLAILSILESLANS
jgi:hypothetical protein